MIDASLSIKCDSNEYLSFNVVICTCGVIPFVMDTWKLAGCVVYTGIWLWTFPWKKICLFKSTLWYENVLSTDMLYSRYLRNVSVLPILNLIQSHIIFNKIYNTLYMVTCWLRDGIDKKITSNISINTTNARIFQLLWRVLIDLNRKSMHLLTCISYTHTDRKAISNRNLKMILICLNLQKNYRIHMCSFINCIWCIEGRYVYEFWNISIHYRCVWLGNSHNKLNNEHFVER